MSEPGQNGEYHSRTECVASTANSVESENEDNYFRAAEWTTDGTSVIASCADNTIRTYVIPHDLLDGRDEPHHLSPYSLIEHNEPVTTWTSYPFFDLSNPATALVLRSIRDHPVGLCSTISTQLVASYPLINPNTETFIHPTALLFTQDGTRFLAGSDTLLSTFDVSRPGSEPLSSRQTGSRARKSSWSNPSTNLKGIISALSIDSASQILAIGTFSRGIGLYAAAGQGECLGAFSVKGTSADKEIGGFGITQVEWSPCGRYLYIVERQSNGILVYDIRQTGQLLCWLVGRKANTNQRMSVSVKSMNEGDDGCSIWAGGTDGAVRIWNNPHRIEGRASVSAEWEAHTDVVSSASVHPTANVVATASGQRHSELYTDDASETSTRTWPDNTLKIWSC